MTIYDKIGAINHYCRERYCDNCVLNCGTGGRIKCLAVELATEAELDKALELIGCKEESTPNKNNVDHPQHYQGKNECIDVMLAMFGVEAVKHFCMCNAYKYRFRAAAKNGAEDIAKAEFYETYLINLGGIDGESKGNKN